MLQNWILWRKVRHLKKVKNVHFGSYFESIEGDKLKNYYEQQCFRSHMLIHIYKGYHLHCLLFVFFKHLFFPRYLGVLIVLIYSKHTHTHIYITCHEERDLRLQGKSLLGERLKEILATKNTIFEVLFSLITNYVNELKFFGFIHRKNNFENT